MVLVFGVDVPLVELLLSFLVVTFVMLIEVTVVMILLFYQLRKARDIVNRLERIENKGRRRRKRSKR